MSWSLKDLVLGATALFTVISVLFVIQHEINANYIKSTGTVIDTKHAGHESLRTLFLKHNAATKKAPAHPAIETRGQLTCNGTLIDSEVIYWKNVPGDITYKSPISPHRGQQGDKYLTFEYDKSGWNNMRMAMECLLVVAHATGRTIVVPPPQLLYLISEKHQHKGERSFHFKTGFEDFYDLDLLRSHRGLHLLHMEEFLAIEGVTGRLKGQLPPDNSTQAWGMRLWKYFKNISDAEPPWENRFIAFPARADNFEFRDMNATLEQRIKAFGAGRKAVFYNQTLQQTRILHFPGEDHHRLVEHFFAFAFFEEPAMRSFYKRFVRDFMRYKDEIHCAGHQLLEAVRAEARAIAPEFQGNFFALHVRRGDFQYKNVKISAQEIVENLHFPNGTAMIPAGAMVYISTDDPDGLCKDCLVQRKPCESYSPPKPPGCPEDTSWKAFIKAGWKIRFMRDFARRGVLDGVNPNTHGMVESIVCSRATLFAGTYFSTFTGYIHRLRGYHGLGEASYYHHKKHLFDLQTKQAPGYGFSREWRAGWTDDGGELI